MSSTLVQFRADEADKQEATQICEKLGMNLPAYLRMCISRLIQDQGIPFSMTLSPTPENRGIAAMRKASEIAAARGIADMSLEEINNEITQARK